MKRLLVVFFALAMCVSAHSATRAVAGVGTGSVALTSLATQATNTVVGNATSGSASPTALTVGSCSTSSSALTWTTNTGFGCNTSINAATLGTATFASPGAIGGSTPAAITGTTITGNTSVVTPQVTLNGTALTSAAGTGAVLPRYETLTAWSCVLTAATPGDLSVTYSTQVCYYSRTGNTVTAHFNIATSAFTFSTASGALRISGLPYASSAVASVIFKGALSWGGITKAGYTDVVVSTVGGGGTNLSFTASGSGQAASAVTLADTPTGGTVTLAGSITYEM